MRGSGTVVLDKRINQWNFLWWQDGKRKSKSLGHHKTKTSAWKAAKTLRDELETRPKSVKSPNVTTLVNNYRAEKMPERQSTRCGYESWLENHILPKWGDCTLTDMQARPVELWLTSLPLSPKSKSHIRGLLHTIWDYAQWRGDVPVERNPMELVTIKGATKRTRNARSLTVAEFHQFITHMQEPFLTIALVCVCFGLRISEALALKWSDVDWLDGKLNVRRGIVRQIVDNVKTAGSEKALHIGAEMLAVLKAWKQTTQFSGQDDWMFASPVQLGRLPWSYKQVWRAYWKAGTAAGLEGLSSHSMRHTFRSWLDAVGTSVAVQQKLMRHADIRTTMNIYGDVVTDEMQQAGTKVAGLALNGL